MVIRFWIQCSSMTPKIETWYNNHKSTTPNAPSLTPGGMQEGAARPAAGHGRASKDKKVQSIGTASQNFMQGTADPETTPSDTSGD
jgi:hypothetical protein